MSKLKVARKVRELSSGMAVVISDGWRGKVHQIVDGETVICIQDGEQPNDWLRGYRTFGRRRLTVDGRTATVEWTAAATTVSQPTVDRRSVAVVDLLKTRLAGEWDCAPGYLWPA
jgi:hypothetical protein